MPREPFDDELPERIPEPRPSGWFEVFCCGTVLLVFVAVVVIFGLLH